MTEKPIRSLFRMALGKLPDSPGIYFFLGKNKKILYIGRATSLRSRVRSYFDGRILENRGPWVARMLSEIKSIDFKKSESVLESVFLEADLIKKFQPLYNTDEKDDKSFNCIVLTKEKFPRVLVVRRKDIHIESKRLTTSNLQLKTIYGPFPHGLQLRDAMKILRRIFPWRDDKCVPCAEILPFLKGVLRLPSRRRDLKSSGSLSALREQAGEGLATSPPANWRPGFKKGRMKVRCKPCFNRQIRLCPGVCTGEISAEQYQTHIRRLSLFLSGKRAQAVCELEREMKLLAKEQKFEEAAERKQTLFALRHIQDVALLKRANGTMMSDADGFRIEAYDLSHFGGKEIVGAMTVVEFGRAKQSEYRLFKIRGIQQAHEVEGLREVLRRRFNHPEWKFPRVIVVDGNEVQKEAAEEFLRSSGHSIPVVAVVKDEKHKPRDVLGIEPHPHISASSLRASALLANSEAHRFALKFQRKRR